MITGETGDRCPNCSAPLSGPFCSSCGQRQLDLDRPFREIASEAMEAFVSFDTRIFRTLWPLIRRPGFLTVEFFEGRRARYIHPFKLYFAFSVMLFVGLALTGFLSIRVGNTGNDGDDDQQIVSIFTVEEETEPGGESPEADSGESGEAATDVEGGEEEEGLIGRVLRPLAGMIENDPDQLNRIFTERLANSIIVLVPVFALLLRFLYWGIPYIKQLVFSLHLHSAAFLIILVGLGIDTVLKAEPGEGWGNALGSVVILVYTFLALRRVYGQGRFRTGLKIVVLLLGYLIALILTMIMTLVVTALTI